MNARCNKGFTLTELLIAIVIIAILAVLAVMSYRSYVLQSHRADGIQSLLSMQMAQEKYRMTNTSYGNLAQVWSGVTTSENGYYTLAVTANSATSYTMTATAVGSQANDSEGGTSCATLTLTYNNGTTTKTPSACWSY